MSTQNRRKFLIDQCKALGSLSLLPVTPFLTSVSNVGEQKVERKNRIQLVDREIVFVSGNPQIKVRPIPENSAYYTIKGIPSIPSKGKVPFSWGEETFTSEDLGAITDNIFCEPGKPWVLHLANSTPGIPDTGDGSPRCKVWYRISNDNGKTFSDLKLLIVKGGSMEEPINGVKIGRKNGYNINSKTPIIKGINGEMFVAVNLHPWDSDREQYYNPVNALTFQDAGVLIGKWLADGKDIEWDFGKWLRIDHSLSTRGLSEPSIVELKKPGYFLMVMRGSNANSPSLPSYTWISFSNDYCRTWSQAKPFTYSDSTNFYVPSSCSTIFRSKYTNRLYWVGNLSDTNPKGNHPRFPLIIGEVDEKNFGLIKESIVVIDTRHPDMESKLIQLSNYRILEHSKNGEIVVVVVRREGRDVASHPSWYKIKLG